ncbi:MAG TPA: TlpA disulfide reductase family protein [Trebonia sp.]|jgi:cytochrome c biogenesis protein CcmG/thiol:disulfide interchange protein DsbE
MSAMSLPGAARRTASLARRHKVITGIVALFIAAVIAVSLATNASSASPTSSAAPNHPAAAGFTLPALGQAGKQISLSQYQGKPVIVNFWASWCEPCQKETPLLASWYKQQHGHVVLLGLDENDTTANALKFADAKGVSYPIGFDPQVTAALAYNVDGLPQTFFLNAQHRIVDHVLGAVTSAQLAKGLRLMNSAS